MNNILTNMFGDPVPPAVNLVMLTLALVVVLLLVFWLFRKVFGNPAIKATRGRQPRLAVTDAANLDDKRRLVLVRRDDVEHLVMIGGATDVLIESNIVRAIPVRQKNNQAEQAPIEAVSAPKTEPVPATEPVAAPTSNVAAPGAVAAGAVIPAAAAIPTAVEPVVAELVPEPVTEELEPTVLSNLEDALGDELGGELETQAELPVDPPVDKVDTPIAPEPVANVESAPVVEAPPKVTEDAKPAEEAPELEDEMQKLLDEMAAEATVEEAPSFVDNVMLIDGVGDKTAAAMAAEGVTTLTQILEMSDEALDAFAEKIGAAGKYKPQEWKIQAQEMKDGKPPRAKIDQEMANKLAAG